VLLHYPLDRLLKAVLDDMMDGLRGGATMATTVRAHPECFPPFYMGVVDAAELTGNLDAAIKAIEAVDTCLGRLMDAVKKAGGALFVTADHGNAEQMFDEKTHQKHTQHTLNRVPALLFGAPDKVRSLSDGKLADVAPTMLALMGRMAAYTGQQITWDQAMNSQERLVPERLDWNGSLEVKPRAQPGVTKFV